MTDKGFASYVTNPEFYASPYPFYARMREKDTVTFTELRGGSWLFLGYDDVAAALKEERLSNARAGAFLKALPEDKRAEFHELADTLSRWLLFLDPPKHTRIRKLLAQAFTQNSIDSLRERIERIVKELLDAVRKQGCMDVMKDLAFELPLRVIIELLGVEPEKRAEFIVWSGDFAQLLGGAIPTLDNAQRAQKSVVEMTNYLRLQVAARKTTPSNDILTTLIMAEEDGDMLTEDELYAQCVLLLFAGHETTRNLIGNGLLALFRNPDQLDLFKKDPSLVRSSVEELLRFDSPVQMVSRVVTEDFDYKGRQIKKGQYGMCFLGAANRDPAQFPDPDKLDLARKDNRHLSFAWGPHLCIGAGLARLEGQIALSTLLSRMPNLKLAAEPTYVMNLVLRGLQSLPVTF